MMKASWRIGVPNSWTAITLLGLLTLLFAPMVSGHLHQVELHGAHISSEQGVHAAAAAKPASEPKVVPLALGGLWLAASMGRARRPYAELARTGSDVIAILLRHRLLAPIQKTSIFVDMPLVSSPLQEAKSRRDVHDDRKKNSRLSADGSRIAGRRVHDKPHDIERNQIGAGP